MAIAWGGIAHHDDHYMFATTNRLTPTRKEPGVAEPCTATHLIWVSKHLSQTRSMLRQQIRMALSDMMFAFFR
jgi:hypothetical protein